MLGRGATDRPARPDGQEGLPSTGYEIDLVGHSSQVGQVVRVRIDLQLVHNLLHGGNPSRNASGPPRAAAEQNDATIDKELHAWLRVRHGVARSRRIP
jgi:hypothetical protein